MANGLSKLWARVTGLKAWDREVTSLHNTVEDDTPAPGDLRGRPTPNHQQDQRPVPDADKPQRYEAWKGEDPGH